MKLSNGWQNFIMKPHVIEIPSFFPMSLFLFMGRDIPVSLSLAGCDLCLSLSSTRGRCWSSNTAAMEVDLRRVEDIVLEHAVDALKQFAAYMRKGRYERQRDYLGRWNLDKWIVYFTYPIRLGPRFFMRP